MTYALSRIYDCNKYVIFRQASSVQEKQPAVNSANVQPQIQISQVHSGAASVAAVATNSPLPSKAVMKVKSEPQDNFSTRYLLFRTFYH